MRVFPAFKWCCGGHLSLIKRHVWVNRWVKDFHLHQLVSQVTFDDWLWSYHLLNGCLRSVTGNLPKMRDLRRITAALSWFSYVSLSNCGLSLRKLIKNNRYILQDGLMWESIILKSYFCLFCDVQMCWFSFILSALSINLQSWKQSMEMMWDWGLKCTWKYYCSSTELWVDVHKTQSVCL